MSVSNSDLNIVEALRNKAETEDLKQILKPALGGYTKRSVREYLNVLRKQQQTMADTFASNQQLLFEEKEALKKDNEALKLRMSQTEAEYLNLSDAIKLHALDTDDCSAADIVAIKNKAAALEEELNRSDMEQSKLESQLAQLNGENDELRKTIDQLTQEKASLKEMLRAEVLELKNQRTAVARLSGIIEENEEEIKFLHSLTTTGQVASLTQRINDLMQQLSAQTEVITSCNNAISTKTMTIETLTQQYDTVKQNSEHLSKTVDSLSEQNEKLLFANKSLADLLENEYKRSIALIKEKSGITVDKLTAAKKLDEAYSRITLLELQLNKLIGAKEACDVTRSNDQADNLKDGIS